jgi:hypothetical protein
MLIDEKMLNAKEVGYNPKDLKSLMTGTNAKGLKKKIKPFYVYEACGQRVEFIEIQCSDLSIAPYQRNLNQKVIDEICSGEFYQAIGCTVNAHVLYYNGEWYYTITDGQHRAYSNPAQRVIAVTSNTLAEAVIFGIGNNKKAKKTISPEDVFHSELFIENSISTQIRDMVEEEFDITIQRHPNHKDGTKKKTWQDGDYYQWGGTLKSCYDDIYGAVHASYAQRVRYTNDLNGDSAWKTVMHKSDPEIHNESMDILFDIVKLVLDVFGTEHLIESKDQPNSAKRVQWFKLVQEWLFTNFNTIPKGLFKGIAPFPYAEIKNAWQLNCWAKSQRNSDNNRLRPIQVLSLEEWTKEADLACATEKKSRGRRKKFLDYVHNAYIVEERRKSAT